MNEITKRPPQEAEVFYSNYVSFAKGDFSVSIALTHAVTHAYLGKEILGMTGILFDLAADVGHVDAQDLVVGLGLGPHSSRMMKS